MVLQKQFKFLPDKGLYCVNMNDVSNYILEKTNEFRVFDNYTSKRKKIELLEEILTMYNEDIQNIQVDMSAMSDTIYNEKADLKSMIQYYDIIWILGTIVYNVFDYGKNALNRVEDGINGPINMGKMLW